MVLSMLPVKTVEAVIRQEHVKKVCISGIIMGGDCRDLCSKIEGVVHACGVGKGKYYHGISPYDKGYVYCSRCGLFLPGIKGIVYCKCCGTRLRHKCKNPNRRKVPIESPPEPVFNIIWQ